MYNINRSFESFGIYSVSRLNAIGFGLSPKRREALNLTPLPSREETGGIIKETESLFYIPLTHNKPIFFEYSFGLTAR